MPTPSQIRFLVFGSMLHGFLSASFTSGGIGTRLQPLRSLPGMRSIQSSSAACGLALTITIVTSAPQSGAVIRGMVRVSLRVAGRGAARAAAKRRAYMMILAPPDASMKTLDSQTLNLLWYDADIREERLREVVRDRLGKKPPPVLDDQIVASYFFAFRTQT